jgi:hypothetical protein
VLQHIGEPDGCPTNSMPAMHSPQQCCIDAREERAGEISAHA